MDTKKDSDASFALGQEAFDHHAAVMRRTKFVEAIPPALAEKEDTIPRRLSATNASARVKLRRLYALLDELGEVIEPFVACGRGCNACCHMNVMVTELEARHIEESTGIKYARLQSSVTHPLSKFSGAPCPFLDEGACSIYESRPFACRKHHSFDTSPYWCAPERSHQTEVPLIQFAGAEEAFADLTGLYGGGLFADIRDFFPTSKVAAKT